MADPGHVDPLLDAAVGLARCVDDHVLGPGARAITAHLAGDDQRDVGRVRRAHLDHTTTRTRRLPGLRDVHQVHEPVEHVALDLGRGRGGGPEHPLATESRRRQLAEDPGR